MKEGGEGDLDLENTPITPLPQGLEVGGSLWLRNTPLSKKYTRDEVRKMAPGIKGDIWF